MTRTTKRDRGLARFVRAHPDKSVAEVIELAAGEGLRLIPRQVYQARAQDKQRGVTASARGSRSLEQQFATLAVRLGYDRATAIVESLLTVRAGT